MQQQLKSRFAILFAFLTVMIAMTNITACGDSDEPGNTSSVAGKWVGDDYDTFYSNVSITFNQDGTGTATMEHYGSYLSVYRASFTYKVKGNKVTTKGTISNGNSDGEANTQDFNNTYEVSGNKLYVKSGNNWYTSNVKSYRK